MSTRMGMPATQGAAVTTEPRTLPLSNLSMDNSVQAIQKRRKVAQKVDSSKSGFSAAYEHGARPGMGGKGRLPSWLSSIGCRF